MKEYRYYHLRDLAWLVLIESDIKELPIPIFDIIKQHDIEIKYKAIKDIKGNDAYGWSDNKTIILNNTLKSTEQQIRFTATHEFGHILLEHTKLNNIAKEQEANSFAARLLMPIGILNELEIKTPQEIADICNVSIEAANYRFERLELLRKRNLFKKSELEKKLIKQFENFIIEYKKNL